MKEIDILDLIRNAHFSFLRKGFNLTDIIVGRIEIIEVRKLQKYEVYTKEGVKGPVNFGNPDFFWVKFSELRFCDSFFLPLDLNYELHKKVFNSLSFE